MHRSPHTNMNTKTPKQTRLTNVRHQETPRNRRNRVNSRRYRRLCVWKGEVLAWSGYLHNNWHYSTLFDIRLSIYYSWRLCWHWHKCALCCWRRAAKSGKLYISGLSCNKTEPRRVAATARCEAPQVPSACHLVVLAGVSWGLDELSMTLSTVTNSFLCYL